MFIKGEAGKQHVVYVCKDEFETSADFVNETLECPSCVAKSISHKSELKDAKLNTVTIAVFGMSSVLWFYRNLMVGSDEVIL